MRKTGMCLLVCVITLTVYFAVVSNCPAAETSFNHSYPPAEWNYQGNDVPETYWTPWLPLGSQQLTRFRMGFRFSTGTIAVKCPVKLTFKYDAANAQSGKDLPIKVKAELIGADYKTFESAFGLHLPNEFQVGFVGITGVPDFLPWYTLPWDLCEILGSVPGLPDAVTNKVTVVCSAIENVGVNMNTQDALPLPGEAAYHDTRTLLDLKLTDFMTDKQKEQFVQNVGIKFYNGISGKLGPDKMDDLLFVVQLAKGLDEAGATEFVTDKCISAAGKFVDLANITTIGDPYFKVEGVELNLLLRIYIPNGKGSGTYPLTFTSSGQEQTVTFRDITPFVQAGDKLVVVVDEITYRFKLKQCLKPIIKISVLPQIPIDTYEKYVTLATAKGIFNENEYKLEVPLSPSTDPIQSLRANPGCTSVQVNWTSPIVPLKGTIKVYQGDTLVKTITENTFKAAHNNIVTDLTKQTTYRCELSAVTESGQAIQGGSVTTTTKENCNPREQIATCNSLVLSSTPVATAGQNYADFSWTTNENASTEVLISPSPDLSANYVACVKKSNGQINQGWVTQGGVRELVTNHSIRISDLEPGTKYYYNVVSWTFKNNNPTDNPINRVGYTGEITTQAMPEQPSAKVSVISQYGLTEADITVNITKVGDSSYHCTAVTGNDGRTQSVLFEAGKSYLFKVTNNACYQDYTSSPTVVAPVGAQGELQPVSITLIPKPPIGAYVYDTAGRPISGATASFPGRPVVTTDASGHYSFVQFNPSGDATVTISKAGYINAQVMAKVGTCGRLKTLTMNNCVMKKTSATATAYVKKQDSTPVAGASVTVKDGSQVLGAGSTDSQGKAVININFSDTREHNLTVTATPPTGLTGAKPASENIKLAAEGSQDVYLAFIVAPPDTRAPVISDVNFNQPNSNTIGISFKSNEEVNTVSLEYKFPNGQTKNTPWYTYNSSLFLGNVAAGYKTAIGDTSIVGGVYKIRIRCKDKAGNQSESGQYDFTMFGDAVWGLKSTAVTTNSIALSWEKFPYTADFAKYTLTAASPKGGTTAEVTDINQISRTLNGLVPNTNYTINLSAQSKAGQTLTAKATLNVWTGALAAPVIRGFEPNPPRQEVNKNITVTAKITDSDSHVKKVTLRATYKDTKKENQIASQDCNTNNLNYSQSFSLNQAGIYYLTLEARDESTPTEETIEYEVLPASGPSGKEEEPQKTEPSEETKSKEAQTKTKKSTTKPKMTEEKLPETKTEPKGDISLAVSEIQEPVYAKQKTTVTVTIKNDSEAAITGGKLRFYIDDKLSGSQKTVALQPGETKNIDFGFTPLKTGSSAVKWELNIPEGSTDLNPENNVVKRSINVQLKPSTQTSSQSTQTDTQPTSGTAKKQAAKTESAQDSNTAQAKAAQKKLMPKIDIKKITIDGEEKGAIPVGMPLTVLVDVNATDDFAGPFAVNVELKKGQDKQKFTEVIEKLNKGSNLFKWDLTKKTEEGSYVLSVEIEKSELKLKDKSTKTFRVAEKKTGTKQ